MLQDTGWEGNKRNKSSSASYAQLFLNEYEKRIQPCEEQDIFSAFPQNFDGTGFDAIVSTYHPSSSDPEAAVSEKVLNLIKDLLELPHTEGALVHCIDTSKSSQGLIEGNCCPDITGSVTAAGEIHHSIDAVWVGELKRRSKVSSDAAKAQTLNYAKALLSSQPWRKKFHLFLTDGIDIYFYCYHRDEVPIKEHKAVMQPTGTVMQPTGTVMQATGIRLLARFLHATAQQHGHSSPQPIPCNGLQYDYTSYLGAGASSSVLCYYQGNESVAVKFYDGVAMDILERESEILRKLEGVNGVPKIVLRGENHLVITPVGRKLHSSDFSADLLQKYIQVVKDIHQKGVLHMDLRLPNLMLQDDGKTPLIVDFGFARTEEGPLSKLLGGANEKVTAV